MSSGRSVGQFAAIVWGLVTEVNTTGRMLLEPPPQESVDQPTGELFEREPFEHLPDELPPEFGEEFGDDLPVAPPGDLLGDLGEEVHSAADLAQRRAVERAQRRRAGRQRLLVLLLGVVVVVVVVVLVTSGGSGKPPATTSSTNPLAAVGAGAGHLSAGSSSSVLPANILIADRNNNRLVVISPLGQVVWTQPLTGPSDAFLSTATGTAATPALPTTACTIPRRRRS